MKYPLFAKIFRCFLERLEATEYELAEFLEKCSGDYFESKIEEIFRFCRGEALPEIDFFLQLDYCAYEVENVNPISKEGLSMCLSFTYLKVMFDAICDAEKGLDAETDEIKRCTNILFEEYRSRKSKVKRT